MPSTKDTGSAATTAAGSALSGLLTGAARDTRVVAGVRADIGSRLSATDLGKIADSDPTLTAGLAAAAAAFAAADTAAARWQADLAEATKSWDALLSELLALHDD
jgi:hypothetical protein